MVPRNESGHGLLSWKRSIFESSQDLPLTAPGPGPDPYPDPDPDPGFMAARHQNRFRGHTGKFISVLTAALIFFWAFSSEPSTQVRAAEPSSGGTLRHVQVRETGRIVSVRTNNKVQAWLGDRLLVLEAASATFTLIRGRNKLVLQGLELLIGKIVTVWGEFVPPNPHHQRPAIKVASWTEGLTPLAPDPLKRSPPGSSGDSD